MAEELSPKNNKLNDDAAVLKAIAAMPEADRVLAEKIHAIVKANAPELRPRTWYGMPAYANKAGKVLCFFQNASKFKTRYATLGFQHDSKLDDGNMWPVSFALTKITDVEEKRIIELVKRAVS
jgi:uncharacterized protein YdhG (YjbR/CyaY superfamily)